jgi:hypothetical protein
MGLAEFDKTKAPDKIVTLIEKHRINGNNPHAVISDDPTLYHDIYWDRDGKHDDGITNEQVKYFIENKLGLCGCGDNPSAIHFVLSILENGENNLRGDGLIENNVFDKYTNDEGLKEFLFHVFDNYRFTDHGTRVTIPFFNYEDDYTRDLIAVLRYWRDHEEKFEREEE